VCRELERLLQESSLVYVKEARGLFLAAQQAGADYKIPDFTLEDPDWGVTWAVDVTVAGAQGPRHAGGLDRPGGWAAAAEATKGVEYASALALTPSAVLAPVGLESFGGVGDGARRFLRRAAEMACGEDRASYAPRLAHYFTQRLVVALLREESHALRRWAVTSARLRRPDWTDPSLGSDIHRVARRPRGAPRALSFADVAAVCLEGAAFG
jgi:hypothetical protein